MIDPQLVKQANERAMERGAVVPDFWSETILSLAAEAKFNANKRANAKRSRRRESR